MLMRDEIKAAIEALLFISGERVGREELMEVLSLAEEDLIQIMREMIVEYNQVHRGIQILTLDGGYIMGTKPEYTQVVSRLGKNPNRRLSPAALETLAIIAYRQPLSKAEIEQIRGVKTDRVIATLMEKGIIKEMGKKEAPGRPNLYGTTHEFLKLFALSSLDDLPIV
ncbi:MAG: SMC-Scp complex subunit ScpB [Firmicutes bacterium HGW-Firmicutes-15]|nr:MAG: SMC-Scp complex subunit ScpB [Firmicutes bacterium HGW-Firmicutes-15]